MTHVFESEILSVRYPVGFGVEESDHYLDVLSFNDVSFVISQNMIKSPDGRIGTDQTFRGPFLSLDCEILVPVQRSKSG